MALLKKYFFLIWYTIQNSEELFIIDTSEYLSTLRSMLIHYNFCCGWLTIDEKSTTETTTIEAIRQRKF